jgi:phosphopantothenoylcysteine decarboxylase/phosphopantothenate--cysteine ligase
MSPWLASSARVNPWFPRVLPPLQGARSSSGFGCARAEPDSADLRLRPVRREKTVPIPGLRSRTDKAALSGQNVLMARVLLGVTGGIAAYKACELCRLLVKAGHDVVPLVTPGAERFVRAETFTALARRPPGEDPYPHLVNADLLVIAPLTANTLAKLAHGLADNVLTEAALAHRGPVLVAPAMSPRMWAHPATQANVALLRERGVELVGPGEGDTAEGDHGVGRMAEPDEIAARAAELVAGATSLLGKHVLVTAGGTREPLDRVRFVGNRSSGRMGVALAAEARRRGATVTLLASNLSVAPPTGVDLVEAPSAADLERETLARADADVVLMAAAVGDYRPVEAGEGKRARSDGRWVVELEPTGDVLAQLAAARANGQVLVGFAADLGEQGLARAREKLVAKGVNLLVFNDVSRDDIGFESPDNEVVLVSPDGERLIGKAPKERIAVTVLDEVEKLLEEEDGRARRG